MKLIQDEPIFTRPSPKKVQNRSWSPEWYKEWSKIWVPWRYSEETEQVRIYASPAMVRNALGFVMATSTEKQLILEQHHPELTSTHPIVVLSKMVSQLCVKHLDECRNVDAGYLQRGMLAMEMNIFTGGRMFEKLNRVNHSCAPNMIYFGMKGSWKYKALTAIKAGEELSHSYLGHELLLPTERRKQLLFRSKCFECCCKRCLNPEEPLRDVPCSRCFMEQAANYGHEESWLLQSLLNLLPSDSSQPFENNEEELYGGVRSYPNISLRDLPLLPPVCHRDMHDA